MRDKICVNFHIHSVFSDGDQTPEALITNLARSGVKYAALTDHDTTEGFNRFKKNAEKYGISTLSGVEVTTYLEKKEIHLLGFGFDINDFDLQSMLLSIRQAQSIEVQSIAASIRKLGSSNTKNHNEKADESSSSNGRIQAQDAISIIHRAGGKVFLAHPFQTEPDIQKLEKIIVRLKSNGLDGIEVFYQPYSEEKRQSLLKLALRNGLLSSAGTDLHLDNGIFSIEIPIDIWKEFRNAIVNDESFDKKEVIDESYDNHGGENEQQFKHHPFRVRSFLLRILFPTLIAIGLFLAALWAIILPGFERTLMDRKREMIRELTQSAWSILASYEKNEREGILTKEEAQHQAIAQISMLRYGPEGKDYFWLQDINAHMLMHPYRPDLNGKDLSNFRDATGTPIFVEFANLVKLSGEGYVDYVWQWNDDPSRLEPKQSYVKGFSPWGWIIGTGIYIDDVLVEIKRIEGSFVSVSLIISGAVIVLLLFVLLQSLRIEKDRQEVVDSLNESTERYHSLLEATTEGTLLIINDQLRFANQTFLAMTGFSQFQLEFMDLTDLLPVDADNNMFWKRYELLKQNDGINNKTEKLSSGVDGSLKCKNGTSLSSVLLINPITFSNQQGFVLIAKKITSEETKGRLIQTSTSQILPVGVFRARNNRRGNIREMNDYASQFFTSEDPSVSDLFLDQAQYLKIRAVLESEGECRDQKVFLSNRGSSINVVSISLKSVKQSEGDVDEIIGVVQDITESEIKDNQKEKILDRLQVSSLRYYEPLSKIPGNLVTCDSHSSIKDVVGKMASQNTSAVVVIDGGNVVGIVTDHDLISKSIYSEMEKSGSVIEVMDSAVITIPETSAVYEALLMIDEKRVNHLVVIDTDGRISKVINSQSLIHYLASGMNTIIHDIQNARDLIEMVGVVKSIPTVASVLSESSAKPRHITDLLATVADEVTRKLFNFAFYKLGPAPTDFAFISMGSQGRAEPTLVSDQDNGIIFLDDEKEIKPFISQYFLRLGNEICDGLDSLGYSYCRGEVMAKNPKWCRSFKEWTASANQWILNPEPEEILNLSIFFDYRFVFGKAEIISDFTKRLEKMLYGEPSVFLHLANASVKFKPLLRSSGSIFQGTSEGDRHGQLNLKDAIIPIVGFARLYSLKNQIISTNTIDRLSSLSEIGVISQDSLTETISAYEFLMKIRLENQLRAFNQNKSLNNLIRLDELGHLQKEQLKHAFKQISVLQKKIGYDFLGGSI